MASTYTPGGIELIADGEQSNTWGDTTNTNWELIEEMTAGVISIALTSTTYTLTTTNGASSNGRHAVIVFTGSPGGTCTVTVLPADMQKVYFIKNDSSESVIMTQGSGGNVTIAAGSTQIVYCDGAAGGAAKVDTVSGSEFATLKATNFYLGGTQVTATAAELNILDGVTASTTELNYVDGVTSNIQTQLDDKITEVTAGSGISGGGTSGAVTVSHADTSSQTSVNNSGNTFIQDITLDAFGHVTGISSNTAVINNATLTLSAGSGLDGGGTFTANQSSSATISFSVESDLRGEVYYIGRDTNDYIGVETTQINFVLDGNTDARLYNNGDFHVDGDLIAYSTSISDIRLKEDISPVEDALNKVAALNGYTFTYKVDGKVSAGVIAQEVEAVLPEAVTETELLKMDDGNEYKVVNYDALHALLIESIKELKARVEELEAK